MTLDGVTKSIIERAALAWLQELWLEHLARPPVAEEPLEAEHRTVAMSSSIVELLGAR